MIQLLTSIAPALAVNSSFLPELQWPKITTCSREWGSRGLVGYAGAGLDLKDAAAGKIVEVVTSGTHNSFKYSRRQSLLGVKTQLLTAVDRELLNAADLTRAN